MWGHMDLDFLGQSFLQLLKRRGLSSHIKHCLDFSFVFSAPLRAWRNLFSASVFFCCGSFQPGCTGIFWPAEGTSQPLPISKKWKIPALLYVGKGFEYRPFHDFRPVPAPTGVGHRSQILEGPVLRPFSYTEFVVLIPTEVEQLWKYCCKVRSTFVLWTELAW